MTELSPIVDRTGSPYPSAAIISPDYEATDNGHRMSTWGLSGSGPNSVIGGSANSLRYRARHARRNNPVIAGGVDSYVSNMIGDEITPIWELDNEEQKQEIHDVWAESCEELDYYGAVNFYGLQELTAGAMIVDGESFARMVTRRRRHDLLVPFQVQLLEADHLDQGYNDIARNGNEIRHAIEWAKTGGRAAYHMWSEHPGESFLTSGDYERVRVPAADVTHTFRPLRPGQQRGGSFLSPLLAKLHEIDQYDDAEVVRKKAAAMWGGFFTNDSPLVNQSGAPQTWPKDLNLQPGMYRKLPQGWKVAFSEPADVGANYDIFMKTQFRMIARGLGITYEQLTGDLSDVNFSAIRAGLIEFRRMCEMVRTRTIISQFSRPIVIRWFHTAMLAGTFKTISLAEYMHNPRRFRKIKFMPDKWDYVQPVDDRIAEQMDIRNGLDSQTAANARRNRDVADVIKEIAADNKRNDELGLVFDSDPRLTAKSGAIQKAEAVAVGR